jgi:hypothetical protein
VQEIGIKYYVRHELSRKVYNIEHSVPLQILTRRSLSPGAIIKKIYIVFSFISVSGWFMAILPLSMFSPSLPLRDSSDTPKLEDTTNPTTHGDWRLYVQN